MAKQKRNVRRRRRKKSGARIFWTLVTFLIVAGALVASLTVFFKVARIDVNGNSRYTSESIIASSEIQMGENLFAINKFKVQEKILSAHPYIEEVKINRRLPDAFVFTITERIPRGYIETVDAKWLVDGKGYLLERKEKDSRPAGFAVISEEQLMSPFAGGEITWGNTAKRELLIKLLDGLSGKNMLDKITQIDVSATYSLRFTYDDRLNVTIGEIADIEKKLNVFEQVLPQLAPTDKGAVNLSKVGEARFTPERIVGDEK